MGVCTSKDGRVELPGRAPVVPAVGEGAPPAGGRAQTSLSRTGKADQAGRANASKGSAHEAISAKQFIMDNKQKVNDVYTVDDTKLGEGSYGCVVLGKHKATGVPRAIKKIPKTHVKDLQGLRKEINMMKMMDHPNIIRLFETFEDLQHIFLVMELCEGGELFDRIVEAGSFNETDAASVIQDLLRCISYMHEVNVCHRDLKPENFLLQNKGPLSGNNLKLIDFGTARAAEAGQLLTTKIGTPYYVAPQVMKGRYDRLCDLWSCGAIMYVLLSGSPPFTGDTDADIIANVRIGRLGFREPEWANTSDEAKFLIRNLMRMSASERFTADQALQSDWIKKYAPAGPVLSLNKTFRERWAAYKGQNRLRKAALFIIAGQLQDADTKQLRDNFIAMDVDGNGQLSRDELKQGLQQADLFRSDADLQELMDAVDSDSSGFIDYTEFIAASIDGCGVITRETCWTAFSVFDRDGDGEISAAEVCQVLDEGHRKEASDNMMRKLDTDANGTINFSEFVKMMGVDIEASEDVLADPAIQRSGVHAVSLASIEVPDDDTKASADGSLSPDREVLAPKPAGA